MTRRVFLLFLVLLLILCPLVACESEPDGITDDDDAADDDDIGDDDDAADDDDSSSTPPGGLRYGFFAIHLDPGSPPTEPGQPGVPSSSRPVNYLPDLVGLVEAADLYNHKLTLMFTAQWAAHMVAPNCELPPDPNLPPGTYAYQDSVYEDCLSLIRGFEAYGHEIAFHHHPESAPNNWDGFSNEEKHEDDLGYLGTVDELLAYVAAIPQGGVDSLTSGTTEEYPQGPHSLRFMSARGPTPYVDASDRGDLASTPCAWSEDETEVWRFRMRSVGAGIDKELEAAAADLQGGEAVYTAGFITHAKDTAPGLAPYEQLFAQLEALGIVLEGLSATAGHYDYTAQDPAGDTDHSCPPDEAL